MRLNDARLRDVDLRGIDVRGAVLTGKLRGVEFWDVELSGEIGRLVVNGIDVGPYVEEEIDRLHTATRQTLADWIERLRTEAGDSGIAIRREMLREPTGSPVAR